MSEPEKVNRRKQRRENRVIAMQFLYMHDINPDEYPADQLRVFLEGQEQSREYYAFAEELIQGTLKERDAIDAIIKERTQNWTFARIARVDLAILRLAIYELLHRPDIPPVVTIDEAIELGKEFSNEESRRFLNGILDKVKLTLTRPLRTPAC
jgi:N utilization substance protein B